MKENPLPRKKITRAEIAKARIASAHDAGYDEGYKACQADRSEDSPEVQKEIAWYKAELAKSSDRATIAAYKEILQSIIRSLTNQ